MEFNIQDLIKKISIQSDDFKNKQKILTILQGYIPSIGFSDIKFIKGRLFIKNISPLKKTHLKRNKNKIIKGAEKEGLIIRDII